MPDDTAARGGGGDGGGDGRTADARLGAIAAFARRGRLSLQTHADGAEMAAGGLIDAAAEAARDVDAARLRMGEEAFRALVRDMAYVVVLVGTRSRLTWLEDAAEHVRAGGDPDVML